MFFCPEQRPLLVNLVTGQVMDGEAAADLCVENKKGAMQGKQQTKYTMG